MSETMNETVSTTITDMPTVSVVKKWVNFSDGRSGEKIVVVEESGNHHKQSQESSNIHLPPPPRRNRNLSNDSDKSPQSSSRTTNHQSDQSTEQIKFNRSTERLSDNRSNKSTNKNQKSIDKSNDFALNIPDTFIRTSSSNLQNVPLKDVPTIPSNSIQQTNSGFKNGDILVSLLPLNTHCAWITTALFKPELVPEELMNPEFRLTVEDYVQAMSTLINDYRFNLYIIFYKKVTLIWLTLGFCILFSLLFSDAGGIILFFGIIIWMLINAFGFFLTCYMKMKMIRNLEKYLANVNEQFYRNKFILAVDDKGKLSCHKITLIFLYLDSTECIKHLNSLLNRDGELESINNTISNLNQLNNNNSNVINLNKCNIQQQDVDVDDIIITGSTPTRLTQKERYGEKLFLRYIQRWAKDFTRQRIGFNQPLHYDSSLVTANLQPRHCEKARCVCQYIEEHLSFKPHHVFRFKDLFG